MKKGITPIIAVILLLLMTVAAGAATMFWFSKLQSSIQTQTETQVSQMIGQMALMAKILGGTWDVDGTSNNIQLTISNTGTLTLTNKHIAAIQLTVTNNTGGTCKCYASGSNLQVSSFSLAPGNADTVTITACTNSNDWSPSQCATSADQVSSVIVTIWLSNGFTDSASIMPK